MELHLAIRKILTDHSKDVLNDERFVNMLADFQCFNDAKFLRGVLRDMIECGFTQKLQTIDFGSTSWEAEILQHIRTFVASYAYRENVICFVSECLLYGFSIIDEVDSDNNLTTFVQHVKTHFIKKASDKLSDNDRNVCINTFAQEILAELSMIGTNNIQLDSISRIINNKRHSMLSSTKVDTGIFTISTDGKKLAKVNQSTTGKVVIPYGVEEIMESAFNSCEKITEVVMPDTVITICNDAFAGCYRLSHIRFSQKLKSIGRNSFFHSHDLHHIDLPFSLETIGDGAFQFSGLSTIFIPKNVKEIGSMCNCDVTVDSKSPYFCVVDGVLFSKDMKQLIMYPKTKTDKTFTIPNSVERIHLYAFASSQIEEIILNDNVETLNSLCFNRSNIHRLFLPKSIKNIEYGIVVGCKKLKEVYLEHDSLASLKMWHEAFDIKVAMNCILHVKSNLFNTISSHEGFDCFKSVVQITESDIEEFKVSSNHTGLLNTSPMPRRQFPIIILADRSFYRNVNGACALNDFVEGLVGLIRDTAKQNTDAEYKIAAMTFSSVTRWMYDRLIEAENFIWQPVCDGGYLSYYDKMFDELNDKLSRDGMLTNYVYGYYPPAILLISCSHPTVNYKSSLERLKNNVWFKNAKKMALIIGSNYDEQMLTDFTGTKEAIIHPRDLDCLKKLFEPMTISS